MQHPSHAGCWRPRGQPCVCPQVFYSSGMSASAPSAPRLNTGSIQQLYNRYADPTDGVILADGVGRFCDDLGVRASDNCLLNLPPVGLSSPLLLCWLTHLRTRSR